MHDLFLRKVRNGPAAECTLGLRMSADAFPARRWVSCMKGKELECLFKEPINFQAACSDSDEQRTGLESNTRPN